MNILELKGEVHELIAEVQTKKSMLKIRDGIRKIIGQQDREEELEATLTQCDDPNNMVSDEDAQKMIDEWLTSPPRL
jgi:hypothetical protein